MGKWIWLVQNNYRILSPISRTGNFFCSTFYVYIDIFISALAFSTFSWNPESHKFSRTFTLSKWYPAHTNLHIVVCGPLCNSVFSGDRITVLFSFLCMQNYNEEYSLYQKYPLLLLVPILTSHIKHSILQ
jgi:hypothetical protein